MAATVVLTAVAARDLSQVQDWLGQPGAGRRSKRAAQTIVRAIKGLSDSAHRHPADRFHTGQQQLVIERHVISYRRVTREDGTEFVFVERIHAPGQDR